MNNVERLKSVDIILKEISFISLPEKMKLLLPVYLLDKERFYYEIAKWVTDDPIILSDLTPLNLPETPDEMKDYFELSDREKRSVTNAFWQQPIVFEYINKVQFVKNKNKTSLQWLQQCLTWVPKEDFSRVTILKEKIKQYKEVIGGE